MTPPSEALYTSPLVGIGINKEWMTHLIGYLSDMRWRWFDENATYEGNNEIERFINLIVLGQPTMFIGQIITGVFATTPPNMLLCDGTIYARSDYPELYDVIHPNFKVPILEQFNVPDLRAKFPIGAGTDTGALYELNGYGGERQVTLQIANMPSHRHGTPVSSPPMTADHVIGTSNAQINSNFGVLTAQSGIRWQVAQMALVGNDQPHNNIPPYGVVNYYIVATL